MEKVLSIPVKFTEAGEIDEIGTLANANNIINKFIKDYALQQQVIKEAVLSVIDLHSVPIKKKFLITFTLSKLNVQPENYFYLTKVINQFIIANCGDDALLRQIKGQGIIRNRRD